MEEKTLQTLKTPPNLLGKGRKNPFGDISKPKVPGHLKKYPLKKFTRVYKKSYGLFTRTPPRFVRGQK